MLIRKISTDLALIISFELENCKLWCTFSVIVYNKTDKWPLSDEEWQRVLQRVTTSATTSDNKCYNEWQRMTTSNTRSDKEWQKWQQMAMSDSEWQQWYSEWKRHSTLQRMDDSHHFNDKKEIHYYFKGWIVAIRVVK